MLLELLHFHVFAFLDDAHGLLDADLEEVVETATVDLTLVGYEYGEGGASGNVHYTESLEYFHLDGLEYLENLALPGKA